MYFTQEDYIKIENWLHRNSVKDTEFQEALPFTGKEIVTVVQDGHNRKVNIQEFINQLYKYGVEDFLNVTNTYRANNITLKEAIRLIPAEARKEGQVITFLNTDGNWEIYQFIGKLNQWNNPTLWNNPFDWEKLIVDSILPDEEDLTKSAPDAKGNSYLSLKDRKYEPDKYSGLGRKILRRRVVEIENPIYGTQEKNLLLQADFADENTTYEIRYDFDLNGREITIPKGCVLDFQGGSISNGKIKGDVCIINANKSFINTYLIECSKYHSSWFKDTFIESVPYSLPNSIIIIDSDITLTKSLQIQEGSKVLGYNKSKIYVKGVHDGVKIVENSYYSNLIFVGEGSESDIKNSYASHAMAGTASNVEIQNCCFYNFYAESPWVVYFRKGDIKNYNITIRDCVFDGFGSNGNGSVGDTVGSARFIYIHENYKNIIIKNNIFRNGYGEEDTDMISIQQKLVDGMYEDANVSVIENIFENSCCSAYKGFCSNAIISNNVVRGNRVYRSIFRNYNGNHVVITNNHIECENLNSNTINIDGCQNSTISDITVIGTQQIFSNVISLEHTKNCKCFNITIDIKNSDVDLDSSYIYGGVFLLNGSNNTKLYNINCNINKCMSGVLISKNEDTSEIEINNVNIKSDTVKKYLLFTNYSTGPVSIINTNFSNAYINSSNLKIENCIGTTIITIGEFLYASNNTISSIVVHSINANIKNHKTTTGTYAFTLYSEGDIYIDGLYGDGNYYSVIDARNFKGKAYLNNIYHKEQSLGGNGLILNRVNADKFYFSNVFSDLVLINYGPELPSDINIVGKNYKYLNTSSNRTFYYTPLGWVDSNGYLATINKGTSEERPSLRPTLDIGFEYFDTTLGKPIYAKFITSAGAIEWVDATGARV